MGRTAVTGIGVVAPGGATREAFWEAITTGHTAIRRITFFDPSGLRSQIAAECDFDPYAAGLDDQKVRRLDRYVELALAAAIEAMTDCDLPPDAIDHDRLATSMGTALGGIMYLEEEYVVLSNRGQDWLVNPDYASPFLYQALLPSSLAGEIALKFAANGSGTTITTGCCAGIDAIGYGHQLIQEGEADIVLAGAAESPIAPLVVASFDPIKATSRRNDQPDEASRPFDLERDGFVLGEGAAVLVLEDMEHAFARDAHIYGEIAGYAGRTTAHHMTGLKADGLILAETIREAIQQTGAGIDQIDYISAHGSGTRQSDRHETAAYKQTFGDRAYTIPISAIKSMIGHALGAAGALQVASCALAIDRGTVPPTMHLEHPDPECDLDYTRTTARRQQVSAALATANGFGGFQSALVVKAITR